MQRGRVALRTLKTRVLDSQQLPRLRNVRAANGPKPDRA